jgi:nitrogen-specific signal transduction histidine kinase
MVNNPSAAQPAVASISPPVVTASIRRSGQSYWGSASRPPGQRAVDKKKRIRRPDGQVRHIYRETELIYYERGRPMRVVAIMHDVTEARVAEVKQRELEKQLHHSQKLEALGTLAGGAAHELNNALVPICALTKTMLQALPPDSEDGEDLEIIVAASDRARKLVQSILSFSRKHDRLKTRVDLADLLGQTLQMVQATLPATVRIDQKISAVPPVPGDADQLNQVVVNLVTNAAQAVGAATGTITVGLDAVRIQPP